jgi:ribosome biogenesis GTPase A
MRPRPVRALMLGFPNVGKSALINRLVRQKVVESARRAGVTRSLRWVRLGQELDLLDAPGVLPPRLDDQQAALRLALCDDIGQAAYDSEAAALAFISLLLLLEPLPMAGVPADLLSNRYGLSLQPLPSGEPDLEGWLLAAAERHTGGDTLRMATKVLDDFRCSRLGAIALELPVAPAAASTAVARPIAAADAAAENQVEAAAEPEAETVAAADPEAPATAEALP